MSFQRVYDNFATRPEDKPVKLSSNLFHAVVRDQFTISTWLLFGALIQATATAVLPYRNIVLILPIILVLGYKLLTTILITCGLMENKLMRDVILKRTTVVFLDEKGVAERPADRSICAIILAVKSHHPLGMLAPGFKEVGDRFEAMVKEMNKDATTHGFIGSTAWLNASDKMTGNEYMSILYFQDEHALHAYAHGPRHTDATKWWRETEKKHNHIGIMHEVFAAPKQSWEGVYINYDPVGLGASCTEVTDASGQKSWVNGLVKVKGKLSYSKGRMGREYGDGKEWTSIAGTKYSSSSDEYTA